MHTFKIHSDNDRGRAFAPAFPDLVRIDNFHVLPPAMAQCTLQFRGYRADSALQYDFPIPVSIARSSPHRRNEWILGRFAARKACEELGVNAARELGIRLDRSPNWPEGLCGSITHKAGLVAVAVGRLNRFRAVGIDSEPLLADAILAEVREQIISSKENDRLLRQDYSRTGLSERALISVVFSAKESVYKCLAPIVGRFFTQLDAAITRIENGRFHGEILIDLSPEFVRGSIFSGNFRVVDDVVHSSMVLAAATAGGLAPGRERE
jgi:enterobactin synthetase component D